MSDERSDDIDPTATGEGADLGPADPITGVPNGDGNLDDEAVLDDDPDFEADPPERIQAESMTTATNDAVAGETVLPGSGDGNDGPTGGSPSEIQPILPDSTRDDANFDTGLED